MIFRALTLLVLTTLMACGKESTTPSPVEKAVVEDGAYRNPYFGLTMPIPEGWFTANKDTEEFLRDVGSGIAAESMASAGAVKAAMKSVYQLLMISEHEMGAAVDFNPNLVLVADKVSHLPGIKSGKEYLFHTKKALLATKMPYTMIEEVRKVDLGVHKWHRLDMRLRRPGKEERIDQVYLARRKGDFMLAIILSAGDDEQAKTLEAIASKVRIDLDR